MYPVIYWVDGYDGEEVYYRSGCTFADNYREAMEHIEAYYGDEICSIKMEMLEENTVLEFKCKNEADRQVKE